MAAKTINQNYTGTIYLVLIIFSLSSCYYDVEEVLYPGNICDTSDVRYVKDIVPILNTHCMTCHRKSANLGNITLEGHAEIIKHVQSGKLLGAIRRESGFYPMPQNANKLPACQIQKIEKWIAEGALNN